MQNVAVFWDYENCPAPSNASGYTLVNSIRAMAQRYGAIKSLRAYTAVVEQFSTAKAAVLRSELQCSGVSLVDCPHNGRKDVADKMMIVDMLAHAIDNSPSSTVILLISGDRDFAYAMSILRLRCHTLVLCTPNSAHASQLAQASTCINWESIAVLPANCINPSKQSDKEPQRSTSQGSVSSTPRFCGDMDRNSPPNDFGVIVDPQMRHAVKLSGGTFPSDDRGNSADKFGRLGQDFTQKPPCNAMRYNPRQNSFNSTHPNLQDSQLPVINSIGYAPRHVPIISDGGGDQENISVPNNYFTETSDMASAMEIPLVVNASAEVKGASRPARHATPEPSLSQPQPSIDSSLTAQMMYQLPVPTPLVVNQLQRAGSPSIQIESAEHSQPPLDPIETTDDTATLTVQDSFVPVEVSISVDEEPSGLKPPLKFTSSESGATGSASSTPSADVMAASKSAPAPPVPAQTARLTPPPQFKALVQILQLYRSQGILKPTRLLVARHLRPANNNPYKKAGVEKWAEYAELARKEGIIMLGGKRTESWVSLAPKWYDAHAM